ncbi:MAG: hypothetical protein CMJ32_11115 [Phycisphaerae bacterium]|nr:hypothetical protein [Phycisphaerae bacterium]
MGSARRLSSRRILLVIAAMIPIGLLLIVALVLSRPGWWIQPAEVDPTEVEQASQFEQGIVSGFQRIRPDQESWAVRIRQEDVNAWLARRLPRWIDHDQQLQWPEGVGMPQVSFQDGHVVVAATRRTLGMDVIIGASIEPSIVNGRLSLSWEDGFVGRLSILVIKPTVLVPLIESAIGSLVSESDPAEFSDPIDPVIGLADGRQVRIIDIEVVDGSMYVQCRTSRRPVEQDAGSSP